SLGVNRSASGVFAGPHWGPTATARPPSVLFKYVVLFTKEVDYFYFFIFYLFILKLFYFIIQFSHKKWIIVMVIMTK
ncbi:MAG: hypothetical protein KAG66_02755, partial [Methylococcales bacterium]|nr:hypothetical protein [Methylococcales bacterium]